LTAKQGGYNL